MNQQAISETSFVSSAVEHGILENLAIKPFPSLGFAIIIRRYSKVAYPLSGYALSRRLTTLMDFSKTSRSRSWKYCGAFLVTICRALVIAVITSFSSPPSTSNAALSGRVGSNRIQGRPAFWAIRAAILARPEPLSTTTIPISGSRIS